MPRTLFSDLVYYREPESLAVCVIGVFVISTPWACARARCLVFSYVLSHFVFDFPASLKLEVRRLEVWSLNAPTAGVRDVSRAARAQRAQRAQRPTECGMALE